MNIPASREGTHTSKFAVSAGWQVSWNDECCIVNGAASVASAKRSSHRVMVQVLTRDHQAVAA